MSREFPWTSLKADTLRAICRDLGAGGKRKKEEMLEFIQGVEKNGLEETLKLLEAEEKETPAKAGAKRARPAKENGAEGEGRPKRGRAAAAPAEPKTPAKRGRRKTMESVTLPSGGGRRSTRGAKGKEGEAATTSSPERAASEPPAEDAVADAAAEEAEEIEAAEQAVAAVNAAIEAEASAPADVSVTVVEETVRITTSVERDVAVA